MVIYDILAMRARVLFPRYCMLARYDAVDPVMSRPGYRIVSPTLFDVSNARTITLRRCPQPYLYSSKALYTLHNN